MSVNQAVPQKGSMFGSFWQILMPAQEWRPIAPWLHPIALPWKHSQPEHPECAAHIHLPYQATFGLLSTALVPNASPLQPQRGTSLFCLWTVGASRWHFSNFRSVDETSNCFKTWNKWLLCLMGTCCMYWTGGLEGDGAWPSSIRIWGCTSFLAT